MKKSILKIIDIYKRIKSFDRRYKIALYSTSISFYMFIASISFINIFISLFSYYLDNINSYLLNNLIDIFDYFKYYEYFSFNPSSIIFILSLVWSSSKVINAYNLICDILYSNGKRRNSFYLRFSSFVMFLFFIFILILELSITLLFKKVLNVLPLNEYIFRFIELGIEFFIIFILVIFLYIYAPPIKMNYKKVRRGALISSGLIYLMLVFMILAFSFISKYFEMINFNNSIILILSIYLLVLFVINYILIFGLIINSKNYKILSIINGNNNIECEV